MADRTALEQLSTFDLAFNLAGKYSEGEKFFALDIIKSRDEKPGGRTVKDSSPQQSPPTNIKSDKAPLAGSKSEKIVTLYNGGTSKPAEIIKALKKKGIVAYPAEVYRVLRKYTNFQ